MSSTTELSEPVIRAGETIVKSPRSSGEVTRILSPRCSKSHDVGGSVGLGMVMALDKFGGGTDVGPVKGTSTSTSTNPNRSNPISIGSTKTGSTKKGREEESTSFDDKQHSSVTTPTSTTNAGRVFCDDEEDFVSIFYQSPPRSYNDTRRAAVFPPSDFLSSCNLCRKKLHGRDIYMYRGEKAFCSEDCRCRQILIDELKENKYCGNEVVVSRSADISSSPGTYLEDQFFSTGIIAI